MKCGTFDWAILCLFNFLRFNFLILNYQFVVDISFDMMLVMKFIWNQGSSLQNDLPFRKGGIDFFYTYRHSKMALYYLFKHGVQLWFYRQEGWRLRISRFGFNWIDTLIKNSSITIFLKWDSYPNRSSCWRDWNFSFLFWRLTSLDVHHF